jgi:VWFA-related protein
MKSALVGLMLSFGMFALVQRVLPQTPASPSPIQLIPRSAEERNEAAHRISLIVQVTDDSGKPTAGLKPTDFTVLDQTKPQTLVRFREVDGRTFSADVHVIIVLDAINDSSSLGHARKVLIQWLSQNKGLLPYPMSLAIATDSGVSRTQESTDPAGIAAELAKITRNLRGGVDCEASEPTISPGMRHMIDDSFSSRVKCMEDQLHRSVDALRALIGNQQQVRGRTILVWTGPGWSWPVEHQANFHDVLEDITTSLREAQVTLDALSWSKFGHALEIRQPIMSVTASAPSTPDQVAAQEMSLPRLAEQSGGQATAKIRDFSRELTSLISGADRFYVLAFDSSPAAAPDEYRTLNVTVEQPQLVVHAAKGYYAQP